MTAAHPSDAAPEQSTSSEPSATPEPRAADFAHLEDQAVAMVRRWLRVATASQGARATQAARLSAVLGDPDGLDFAVGFVDRVVRTEDNRAAAAALSDIARSTPAVLPTLDRAQIKAGAAAAPLIPELVVPIARRRLRSMVGHMVIDARDKQFGEAVGELKSGGHRLNINLLGEAVLGEGEADHHLEETHRLLAREDVDYVSIKVSSVASQLSLWAFNDTVDYVVNRLRPLYREAASAPAGQKIINLDMEEHRDLELTIAVFTTLLSEPEFTGLEAGIVVQAYLPDALSAVQRLSEFAATRSASGGAGIKVRLVKGANLAVERVHAEVADWPLTTEPDKQSTDANYLRVLVWLFSQQRMRGLRLGVAGHNLFDIAFAHLLAQARGVSDHVEFEMLHGMAEEQREVLSRDVGDVLLYVPAVRPQEFDVAISYLVRRLEENAAPENFMSGIFDLRNGNAVFDKERTAFSASVRQLQETLLREGDTPPPPNRHQNRAHESAAGPQAPREPHHEFRNEPDTDPSLPANQRWVSDLIAQAVTPAWMEAQPEPPALQSSEQIERMVVRGREAASAWQELGAAKRAAILMNAAQIFAARRGAFLQIAAAEVGKLPGQTDPEVSEAIDFIRYYAHQSLELEEIPSAHFEPDSLVLVTPPWNFPVAIPTGSTVAALAAGASVIHKPSPATAHTSMLIVRCLWEAGVPADVLQICAPLEGDLGRALVANPGIDRVILTGASDTAALFQTFRPELRINAETSGKNALIITPSADRDLAVADLVASAFGHAGQKCSAASLAILVGSVGDSERFRRQLVDAAASLIVDWPANLRSTMGPLTEDPSDKLLTALTTLDDGEEWLVEPRRLDDSGRLWSPGIRTGVKPGSFFHLTEAFGPVLGIMHARSLTEAVEWQNAVDYGLTAGLHSLDTAEVEQWLESVEAGNVYVNRSITGAIVQRQPFGGWKKSSVGLGSKAGGPNYLLQFGRWVADAASSPTPTDEWLESACADDARLWEQEFSIGHDPTGLRAEANIFRYRPRQVTVRVSAEAHPYEVRRVLHAAHTVGAPVLVSLVEGAPAEVGAAVAEATFTIVESRKPVEVHSADEFAALAASGHFNDGVGARIRVVGAKELELTHAVAGTPEIAIVNDPVTGSARIELRHFVHEQSVSMTLHRFGNRSRDFAELADALLAGHSSVTSVAGGSAREVAAQEEAGAH